MSSDLPLDSLQADLSRQPQLIGEKVDQMRKATQNSQLELTKFRVLEKKLKGEILSNCGPPVPPRESIFNQAQ